MPVNVGTCTHDNVHYEIDGLVARAGACQVVRPRLDDEAAGAGGAFAPLHTRGVYQESLESRKARVSLRCARPGSGGEEGGGGTAVLESRCDRRVMADSVQESAS